jgi:arabinan endo-1,5-alpha-L-arabinosidase
MRFRLKRRMLAALGAGTAVAALAIGLPAAGSAAATTKNTAATYTNPVFAPDLPDPSIIQDKQTGLWYAYGTTDDWTSSPSSLHIMPILESRNLVNWTFVRNVFSPVGTTPAPGSPTEPAWAGNQWLWAPEVHYIGGQYVMYYAASTSAAGGSEIGLATSSSPAGPWKDSGGPLITQRSNPGPGGGYMSTIDPDEIQAPSGQRYLYWGSFTDGIWVQPLTSDGLSVEPGSSPVHVAAGGLYEGTNVVLHGGYYYLMASSGGCCSGPSSGYEEVVGRSRSPLGPFVDKQGVPLLDGGISVIMADNGDDFTGPGGVTTFQDDAGHYWMVLHVIQQSNPYLGSGATRRPLALEPVEWGPGGWPEINYGRGVTAGPQPTPAATDAGHGGPAYPDPLDRVPVAGEELAGYSTDFDATTLPSRWSWVNEDAANWSLSSDPGTLTIVGQGGQFYETGHDGQNVLLEKAPAGNFVAQTKVALDPTQNTAQAGLVLWQNDDNWMKLVAESNWGNDVTEWGRQYDVTNADAGFDCGSDYPANTCPVYGSGFLEVPGFSPAAHGKWAYLRIVKDGNNVTAYTSWNGQTWFPGATYNLDGFSPSEPLSIGVMATSTNTANTPIPAHFAYVRLYHLTDKTAPAA